MSGPTSGSDPSMEDILSSIRRILSEDEAVPSPPPPPANGPPNSGTPSNDDVLVLDASMMVPETPPPNPAGPTRPAADNAETAKLTSPAPAIAAAALQEVVRSLTANPATATRQGGPTIEDLVRAELRPLLQAWLDKHLEPLLERLVRVEIERVVNRAPR